MRRQAATGESMPPDSNAITFPPVPTGRPPVPLTFSKDTKAVSIEFESVPQETKIETKPTRSGPPLVTWIAAGAALLLAGGGVGAYVAASSSANSCARNRFHSVGMGLAWS